jgi:ribose/xylose/arabinose/galactoside ABC-type transport system permease subunit
MARRPEFGAFVAALLVYAFFAVSTHGAGFVTIDGTAGWLDTAAELGIIAIPVGVLMVAENLIFPSARSSAPHRSSSSFARGSSACQSG